MTRSSEMPVDFRHSTEVKEEMSLTSHLEDKNSPIREFMGRQFSGTRRFLANPRKELRKAYTIAPDRRDQYPWSRVGIALDYRLRYYFQATPCEELVANKGAHQLSTTQKFISTSYNLGALPNGDTISVVDTRTGRVVGVYVPKNDGAVGFDESVSNSRIMEIGRKAVEVGPDCDTDDVPALASQYQDFFGRLEALMERNSPVGRRLPHADENELNGHCFVLALLEEAFRTGRVGGVPGADHSMDAEALLDLADSDCIDDLTELSWEFYDGFNCLLGLPYVLNPTFEGSEAVGGADADVIVDGTLIEIKTTSKSEIRREWLWQLLGYVLLDYTDAYGINGIGLYLARQGRLIKWDMDEVMHGLGSENSPNVRELRTQFMELMK